MNTINNFTIQDTVALKDILMQVYCDNQVDEKVITHLCFARNVAERVAVHFKNTHNKVEFYRSILNDTNLKDTVAYSVLENHYSYLKGGNDNAK